MLVTINTSGKKEGKGGTEAFDTRRAPSNKTNQYNLDSTLIIKLRRDPVACLKLPIMLNSPLAVHP